MQLDGAIEGGSTSRPRRRPLSVLVGVLMISAMVALVVVWAEALMKGWLAAGRYYQEGRRARARQNTL